MGLIKCSQLRRSDFHSNYMIKYNINSAKRNGYLSMSLGKLKTQNPSLYNVLLFFESVVLLFRASAEEISIISNDICN